jgi:phage tail-like protein
MTLALTQHQMPHPTSIAHVADFKRRYPGEQVTLHTRVDVLQHIPMLTVSVGIPREMSADSYRVIPSGDNDIPIVYMSGTNSYIEWRTAKPIDAGTRIEYEVSATIAVTETDTDVESTARAATELGDGVNIVDGETARIAVMAKGSYLKHLPSLYFHDDLMGRFLMLFESFWKPIEQQIDVIEDYFDPRITPPGFLPWLASWADMTLDERWPEDRQRRLLGSMAVLHRKRGTKAGLELFLELFTGEKPVITEHRAQSFRLGAGARLGQAMALGASNEPHTFAVHLALPPVEASSDAERVRKERDRRSVIESIIEAEKPAHTNYTLTIEQAEPAQATTLSQ